MSQLSQRILEKLGYRADIVANGRDAVTATLATAYDLILMDVQMPELDGFEATALIRQADDAAAARVPIIAMTAHAMKGDRERCLAAGMNDYLAKPIQPHEVAHMIERHLGRETGAPGPAEDAAPPGDDGPARDLGNTPTGSNARRPCSRIPRQTAAHE